MANIVIAWELGEAWGHLTRCLRLATALCVHGHSVTLVLKDIALPVNWPATAGLRILAAPAVSQRRPLTMPCNYAAVLWCCGFDDADKLANRLRVWSDIFYLSHADLVLADHAPTALLAAAICDIPHLSVGNGFTIPPASLPWPSIRFSETVSESLLYSTERDLDRVIIRAQQFLGRKKIDSVRALFGRYDLLDTFAELDHYGHRQGANYVGPIVSLPAAFNVKWQYSDKKHILAYLRPGVAGLSIIMTALGRLNAEVLCVLPGLTPKQAAVFANRQCRVATVPVDFSNLLPDTDLAVGYGNSGFSTQALLAGVPLLMSPQHVEQAMFSARIEQLGAGLTLARRCQVMQVEDAMHALLERTTYKSAALAFEAKYQGFSTETAVDGCVSTIRKLLIL